MDAYEFDRYGLGMKIHKPPMTFKDAKAEANWRKSYDANRDPYGDAVLRFASEWATRAEQHIPKGLTLGDVVDFGEMLKETSSAADDEGITGFMYGAAVSVLAGVWVHGETLRRWHNLKTQIGREGEEANKRGGTLNPALLNIGKKAK